MKKTRETDCRRLDHIALSEMRRQAVLQVQDGRSPELVAIGISAVSARGTLRFTIVKGSVGAATFIDFMKRLLVGATKPVYLIVDGHPSHKAKVASEWITAQAGRIRLFLLPGYSP